MQKDNKNLILFIISIILGFSLAVQLSTERFHFGTNDLITVDKMNDLIESVQELETDYNEYKDIIREYQIILSQCENEIAQIDSSTKRLFTELQNVRNLAGLLELEGPGVEIIISDAERELFPYEKAEDLLVHDTDLLLIVNDLRAAGAEAISINNYRILSSTQIKCGGPIVLVDDMRFAPPYVISAVGNPDRMDNIFKEEHGLFNLFSYYGLKVSIRKLDNIRIPKYSGSIEYKYAKPVEMKEGE